LKLVKPIMPAVKSDSAPDLVLSEVAEPLGMEELAVGSGGLSHSRHVPNAISAVVLFLARLLAVVVQLRLVDKYWGGGYTGLNALSNQVLLYVTLLELGLSQSATSLLYEPILHRNSARVSAIVSALRHDVRMLAAAGSLVVFPAVIAYAYWVHGAVPLDTMVGTLCCVAATGILQLTAIHLQVFLNASERLDRVNFTFGAGYLLKTAIGLPLAIYTHNFLLLPCSVAALTVGELHSLRLAFRRAFPEFCAEPWRTTAAEIRKRAKFVMIQRIAGVAYYQSDFIILSITTSLVAVRDYAMFQYVSAALLSAVGLLAASVTTSVARLQLFHHAESRRRQYVTAQSVMCLIGAVLMLAFWFNAPTVVTLAFGADSAVERPALALFGVVLFLNVVKVVDDIFIIAKGAFEIGYWIPAVEVLIYVGTGVLLSRQIGFAGILIASMATNLIVSTVLRGIVLAKPVFDSTRSQWYGNRLRSMAIALIGIVPLACLYGLAKNFLHPTLMQFAVTSVLALGYMLLGARWILVRNTRYPRPAPQV
jgi:O-antigen/teichoic acid export membrane protein